MSEQAVLWLFGILLAALATMTGTIARIFWNKLSEIDSGAFAAFKAKDDEREKQTLRWRDTIDRRLDDKKSTLKDFEHRITRLERNGHG